MSAEPTRAVQITARSGTDSATREDRVAVEEPLEIRVQPQGDPRRHSVAITMRTPGHDRELAAGFLVSEAVVIRRDQVQDIRHCGGVLGEAQENVINVSLSPGAAFDAARLSRNVYTSSSCGICGKASIEMIRAVCPAPLDDAFSLPLDILLTLPDRLATAQPTFAHTGGLHAAALFDSSGALLLAREDVGRHNAVDKVIGAQLLDDRLPSSASVLLVSGRASYELMQKALMAGIPMLAAVGAPSSLAVETANAFGATLVGFLRDGRCNVYTGRQRII